MKKLYLFILILGLVNGNILWANDTCTTKVSLLTCTQGADAYSAFGHTAIRIKDPLRNLDRVYNYGTFDDSDPLFYWKFGQGIMLYELSAYDMVYFLREYSYFGRGVEEQVLNLSCDQIAALEQALEKNYEPANRVYTYHFLESNCTTKSGDIIFQIVGDHITVTNPVPDPTPTFRQLLHEYLDESYQDWFRFGIDILLGSTTDRKVDSVTYPFLPKNLYKRFAQARIDHQPLVAQTNHLLPANTQLFQESTFTPAIILSIILMLYVSFTFVHLRWTRLLVKAIEFLIYFSLGIIGTLLLFLWLIRVDEVSAKNYNLLWALPTHLIFSILLLFRKKWIKHYFRITLVLAVLTGLCWWFIPQNLNTATIPVLGLIVASSYNIIRRIDAANNRSFNAL